MNIANTAAFNRAQYEYDNAEPDYENEAFELAVEARADDLWQDAEEVQSCIAYYGVNTLPLSTCQEMVKALDALQYAQSNNLWRAADPDSPRWLLELVAYIDDNCVRKWAEQLVREGE